jgi:hypothetical protein
MSDCQVYFIECSGRIKIGHSRNVQERLKKFATGSAFKFSLLGAVDGDRRLEHKIHLHLVEYREHGEWFRDCSQVRDVLLQLSAGHNIDFKAAPAARIKEARPRRSVLEIPAPKPPPLRSPLIRIEACAERYLGPQSIYPAPLRREKAPEGFSMLHSALHAVGSLVDELPLRRASGDFADIEDVAPAAASVAAKLECDFERLFAGDVRA